MSGKKPMKKPASKPVKAVKAATAPAAAAAAPVKKRTVATPQTPRGMKDILPSEAKYWRAVRTAGERLAAAYGFEWIETPIVEETALFVRGVGKQTDIVEKEMFTFVDQGGDELALRPEATAAIARAYINHGMLNMPQPVKLFYHGPMFRHERPQAGRYRQFHQFGFETIGEQKPVVDAELIICVHRFFLDLGLQVKVEVNSIGTAADREQYREKLVAYYRQHRNVLCENCKVRLSKNPLRVLDCKEPGCEPLKQGAPQIVDVLSEDSKNHFMKVLEYLEDAEVPFELNPYLVRGLDYYSHTVFEAVFPAREGGSKSAAAAGGRYDGLIELLGGRPTPGAGFAIGLERTILEMKERQIIPLDESKPVVFLAQLGEPAKRKAFKIFDDLRRAGIPAAVAFSKDALKAQMEVANRMGVKYTLLIGQKEVLDGTIIIRDMEAGIQEMVDANKVTGEIAKKLVTAPLAPLTAPAPRDSVSEESSRKEGDSSG
ncbi:histidine--tRNA ligase [Patescibacteria group bacterium]|nr:MAG: histidine--tRNA ligase [Patescibacteria group bacterium]